MPVIADRDTVVATVGDETRSMLLRRMGKLRKALTETMSLSQFLLPILYDLHSAANFAELGELLVIGHLMVGHSTSFGKLLDEKVLPRTFQTTKLTGKFRQVTSPFEESCFDDIDHLVVRGDASILLSLKASRWTIQLAAAVNLNKSFYEILERHSPPFGKIVVGVFAGKKERLTDKYDILRGINKGKKHNVFDLTKSVDVYAGREFWSWLNNGEESTQEWVLDGILDGLRQANCAKECADLLQKFVAAFNALYAKHVNADGTVNWHELLHEVNG